MKVYKLTFLINFGVSLFFLIISWVLYDSSNDTKMWFSNISGGIFASAILLVGTSVIGYLVEEKRLCLEYYWKLVSLRSKVLILSTLPVEKSSFEDYYNAISQVNELLVGYFAMFEQDFVFFKRRKKIQKILEIHNMLYEFKNLSINAELYFRQYMAGTRNCKGQKNYEFTNFKNDIKEFTSFIDDYEGTGQYFILYFDKKIEEYNKLLK